VAKGGGGATAPTAAIAATATDELDDALARCYRHLGSRDHSVAELRAKLERAKLGTPAIDAALALVAEQGYLDDARYARLLAQDRRNLDGWGVDRIRARLRGAGIEPELIEQTLAGHDTESELAAAGELLARRCGGPLTDNRARQRAFGILVRAGYDSDIAYEAIRAAARGDDDAGAEYPSRRAAG
jgi:regulatory protein